jgi:GAF domain-containing protein
MPDEDGVVAEGLRLAASVGLALFPPGYRERLQTLADDARVLYGAAACSIAVVSDSGTRLEFRAASGVGAAEMLGTSLQMGTGIAGWVASSGQAIEVTDVARDARFARDVADRTGYVPQAILAAPLETQRQVVGVVEVLDRDAGRPGADRDLFLLAVLARQMAAVVESGDVFSEMGRVLLAALHLGDGDLVDRLEAAASTAPDPELAELAALFARLQRHGTQERLLAVRLTTQVLRYADRNRLR